MVVFLIYKIKVYVTFEVHGSVAIIFIVWFALLSIDTYFSLIITFPGSLTLLWIKVIQFVTGSSEY